MTQEYRRDGWPLCPQCGEDELASVPALQGSGTATATDQMYCYQCRWKGTVQPESATVLHCSTFSSSTTDSGH